MTPTKEQLELAAKAAGIKIDHWTDALRVTAWVRIPASYVQCGEPYRSWQPLTSKSDSFDLMVACKSMPDYWGHDCVEVIKQECGFTHRGKAYYADHNNDKGLALMAAAFLCAIALGRAM